MIKYATVSQTSIGPLYIVEEADHIVYIHVGEIPPIFIEAKPVFTELLQETEKQLHEFFARKRKLFTIPIKTSGTPFQEAVWHMMCTIPYGETRSYKDIAILIGKHTAYRAVGGAIHRNPIPFIIPCHRVIGSDGSLVGFGSGLPLKEHLLALERD